MEYEKPPPYSEKEESPLPPYTQGYPPAVSQPAGHVSAAYVSTPPSASPYQAPAGYVSAPSEYVSPPPSVSTYQAPVIPAGYQAVSTSALPNYGSTVYVQQPPPQTQIIYVGGCPACKVGVLEDDFTCLGVLCAILFFPLGLICCFAMRQRRCPNCGATFG